MTRGLHRFQQSKQLHFVTFSCYRRLPRFIDPRLGDLFLTCLEESRLRSKYLVYGYVVMPEHVHLLVSEPLGEPLANALKTLKMAVAKRARAIIDPDVGFEHFWQARYHDVNLFTDEKRIEKLRYLHRNPVNRGLCKDAAGWRWRSFRHYAFAEDGPVQIESEWTARIRSGGSIGQMATNQG